MLSLPVEIRIQDAYLGDGRNRQSVPKRSPAYRLGRGTVIDAEGALTIGRDVRMNPCHPILGIVIDDLPAKIRSRLVLWDVEAVRKFAFDQVAGHGSISNRGLVV